MPVFEAIVKNALRLCDGFFSIVYRFDGAMMSVAADHQVDPRASVALRALYPAPARRDHIVGRACSTGEGIISSTSSPTRSSVGQELTRSVDQLAVLGEIGRAVTSTLDVETVLDTIVSRAPQLAGADGCAIYEYDEAAQTPVNRDPLIGIGGPSRTRTVDR
jgi:hypothetical protein